MDMSNIAERLEAKFGTGSRPELRRALYQRLEKCVEEHGQAAYRILAVTAADSLGKKNPGRYFAHVVMARLHETGILTVPEI